MSEYTKSIIKLLNQNLSKSKGLTVTAGFDGFIDEICRVVKYRPSGGEYVYYRDIEELSKYLSARSGRSCSLELQEINTKMGGNMPLLSHGLGCLGIRVNCIGALGWPDINTAFKSFSPNCCKRKIVRYIVEYRQA